MKNWYSITAAADTAEIKIFGPIGNTWDGEGVTARKFISDLQAIKEPNVELLVNSPGGSLFDGISIYTAMAASGKNITAKVMGVAASAASLIVMAASKISMPKNTHMMVHKAGVIAAGNADEMRATADWLDTLDNSIANTYAARTGKPLDEINALLNKGDVWMSAEEAVAAGFADEATDLVKVTAQFDLDKLPENVRAALAPPAPAAPPGPTLADRIRGLVEAAGLGAHVAAFALDASLVDEATASAAISQAREVQQLAVAVGKPEMAATLISGRKTRAEAQTILATALAEADEATSTSNAPRGATKQPTAVPTGPVAFWSKKA